MGGDRVEFGPRESRTVARAIYTVKMNSALAVQGMVVWWVGRCLSASAAWGGFNCNLML